MKTDEAYDAVSAEENKLGVARRTVAKGALWSAPVIAGVTMVPAASANDPIPKHIRFDQHPDVGGDGFPETVGPGNNIVAPDGEDPIQALHPGVRFNTSKFLQGVTLKITDEAGNPIPVGEVQLTILSLETTFAGDVTTIKIPFAAGHAQFGRWDENPFINNDPLTNGANRDVIIRATVVGYEDVHTGNGDPLNGPDAKWVLGNVFKWGDNNFVELSLGYTNHFPSHPDYMMDNFQAKAIYAGTQFTLMHDTDGYAWTSGANGYGQLGIGSTVGVSYTPVKLTDGSWQKLAVCAGHVIALDMNVQLWPWGSNATWALGLGSSGPAEGTTVVPMTKVPSAPGVKWENVCDGGWQFSGAIRSN
ncbi:MAG: hypothetical protein QM571_04375 [Micrococcaceae bacterium]